VLVRTSFNERPSSNLSLFLGLFFCFLLLFPGYYTASRALWMYLAYVR
jgi:hypothetical protein